MVCFVCVRACPHIGVIRNILVSGLLYIYMSTYISVQLKDKQLRHKEDFHCSASI